jgi:hypothetical protein
MPSVRLMHEDPVRRLTRQIATPRNHMSCGPKEMNVLHGHSYWAMDAYHMPGIIQILLTWILIE